MPDRAPAEHSRLAEEAIEPILRRAVDRGDHAVFLARTILGALVLLRVLSQHLDEVLAGNPKYVLVASTLLAGTLLPPIGRIVTRRHMGIHNRAMLSVTADALMVTLALLPMVMWPYGDYRGCLREVDVGFFALATVASGLRLSRRAVAVGVVGNVLGLSLLVTADLSLNADRLGYGSYEMILMSIMLGGSGVLAWLTAAGTRTLVYEGARATLLAERARQRLGVYVSEEIAAQALSEGRLELGGERRELAVLFSDLRGFTSYSETIPPEQLVGELNAYLTAMVAEIRREGGIVDKYIGDAIMAVFGLTGDRTEAAARALRAAAGMDAVLTAHNLTRTKDGRPPLRHGIGVHAGPVVAGNIGTPERMQFTVIGDVVNLASRLESATKELGVSVIASRDAVEASRRCALETPACTAHGAITVKGAGQPIEVFVVTTKG